MIRPEREIMEALARIANTRDGELLLQWIRDSSKDVMDVLMSTHEPHIMHRGQGAIKELSNIQNTFSDSINFARANK
jgi:hypothetical protein